MSDTKMVNTKICSFRFTKETEDKFKALAKEAGISQEQFMNTLINNFKLQTTKVGLPNREKEIETFEGYANNLVSLYLNSLMINTATEDRIREELSKQIQSKDDMIIKLQENIKVSKESITNIKEKYNTLEESNKELLKSNVALEELTIQQKSMLEKTESQNIILQELLAEHKQYKEENKILINTNAELSKDIENSKELLKVKGHELIDKELKIENLKEKTVDLSNTVKELKTELTKANQNIDLIRKEQEDKVEKIEKEYKNKLEEEKKELIKNFEEKVKIEEERNKLKIEKIELDIQKQIENLNKKNEDLIHQKVLTINALQEEIKMLKESLDKKKK